MSVAEQVLQFGRTVDEHAPLAFDEVADGDVLKIDVPARHTVAIDHALLASVAPLENPLKCPHRPLSAMEHIKEFLNERIVLNHDLSEVERHTITLERLVFLRVAERLVLRIRHIELYLIRLRCCKNDATLVEKQAVLPREHTACINGSSRIPH